MPRKYSTWPRVPQEAIESSVRSWSVALDAVASSGSSRRSGFQWSGGLIVRFVADEKGVAIAVVVCRRRRRRRVEAESTANARPR